MKKNYYRSLDVSSGIFFRKDTIFFIPDPISTGPSVAESLFKLKHEEFQKKKSKIKLFDFSDVWINTQEKIKVSHDKLRCYFPELKKDADFNNIHCLSRILTVVDYIIFSSIIRSVLSLPEKSYGREGFVAVHSSRNNDKTDFVFYPTFNKHRDQVLEIFKTMEKNLKDHRKRDNYKGVKSPENSDIEDLLINVFEFILSDSKKKNGIIKNLISTPEKHEKISKGLDKIGRKRLSDLVIEKYDVHRSFDVLIPNFCDNDHLDIQPIQKTVFIFYTKNVPYSIKFIDFKKNNTKLHSIYLSVDCRRNKSTVSGFIQRIIDSDNYKNQIIGEIKRSVIKLFIENNVLSEEIQSYYYIRAVNKARDTQKKIHLPKKFIKLNKYIKDLY